MRKVTKKDNTEWKPEEAENEKEKRKEKKGNTTRKGRGGDGR